MFGLSKINVTKRFQLEDVGLSSEKHLQVDKILNYSVHVLELVYISIK